MLIAVQVGGKDVVVYPSAPTMAEALLEDADEEEEDVVLLTLEVVWLEMVLLLETKLAPTLEMLETLETLDSDDDDEEVEEE